MSYDKPTYFADLDLLQVPPEVAPMPRVIMQRRARLAKERGHDQAAITAAFERLMIHATRLAELHLSPPEDAPQGEPEEVDPVPAAPAQPDPQMIEWEKALAGQTARHERRRGKYHKLKPAGQADSPAMARNSGSS